MIGQTISHYSITEKLGEGGMGIVYKATDTKLDRPVALKFLAPHLLRDEEGRKRFQREAKAAASLDHPNICTVHEIDEFEGRTFIVMAFLEGRPLSELIQEGPLKLPEALSIAIQMAEGLEAAHAKGITHRDIKPDNVMLMSGSRGLVKLMDFGLAQLAGSSKFTREGTTLGTVNYMSPEQAEGAPAGHATDIWSLGVVLYEMVAGQRPFRGDFDQAIVYSIMNEPPEPLTAVRTGVPKELERIVNKCLAKKAEERYRHADELLGDLQAVRKELEPQASRVSAQPAPAKRSSPAILGAVAAVVLAALGLGWWFGRSGDSTTQAPPQYKLSQITRDTGYTAQPALSPDGKLLAYSSDRGAEGQFDIWVQQFSGGQPIPLASDPADDYDPSFSPDGGHVVFVSDRDGGGIYVVPALGGGARRIADRGELPRFSPDGKWISFSRSESDRESRNFKKIYRVPSTGGRAIAVETGLPLVGSPVWSPDGTRLLFMGSEDPWGIGAVPSFDWWIVPSAGGEAAGLNARAAFERAGINLILARWRAPVPRAWLAEGDRVLFSTVAEGSASNLWEARLSVAEKRLLGEPRRLTSGTGESAPSASRDGRIAFVSSQNDWNIWSLPLDADKAEVTGEPERVISGLAFDAFPSISGDGRKLVFTSNRSGNQDVWLRDLETGETTQLTVGEGSERRGEITQDGARVAFARTNEGKRDIYVLDLRRGVEQLVIEGMGHYMDWTPDERRLLFYTPPPLRWKTVDIETGELQDVSPEHPQYAAHSLRYSPDGQWLAFSLLVDPGRLRSLFIARAEDGKPVDHKQWIQVTDGFWDYHSWWSPDGNTLYFLSQRDGFPCIWAQALDSATKRPTGTARAVKHFHGQLRITEAGAAQFGYAVTADRLYLPLLETRGNIWLAEPTEP
jgi:serine/threonine protein kinase